MYLVLTANHDLALDDWVVYMEVVVDGYLVDIPVAVQRMVGMLRFAGSYSSY